MKAATERLRLEQSEKAIGELEKAAEKDEKLAT